MASSTSSGRRNTPFIDWLTGSMQGAQIHRSAKALGQLRGIFSDLNAWQAMDPETVVYRVQSWEPIPEGTEGGLFWGATIIEPGRVGDEYFMTQGHFHSIRDRAEYYCTVESHGVLVLVSEDGSGWTEMMSPGSLHYIPDGTAHRVVNISDTPLIFWASWPSDAGHDYDAIRAEGFGIRILLRDGIPTLVPDEMPSNKREAVDTGGRESDGL